MTSKKAIRQEESIYTVLAKIGGIMNVLNKGSILLTKFIGKYYFLAKQMQMLIFNTQDFKKVDKLQRWRFQCKFFCFKRFFCSSKKRCRIFKDNFYSDIDLFE